MHSLPPFSFHNGLQSLLHLFIITIITACCASRLHVPPITQPLIDSTFFFRFFFHLILTIVVIIIIIMAVVVVVVMVTAVPPSWDRSFPAAAAAAAPRWAGWSASSASP